MPRITAVLRIASLVAVFSCAVPARAEFIRGIYTYGAPTFDTIAAMGFNMVVSGPAWETELVRARQLGLKVIPSWYGDDTPAYDLMRSLDTDPMILAWYPFDEPDIYRYSADVVRAKIATLRGNGLRKPVYLTVFSPSKYATYMSSTDIFGITPYPIGSDPGQINMNIVGRYARYAHALCGAKPFFVCVPVFFQRPWQYRAPTPKELHNIVYQALMGHPDGVLFFIWRVQGLDGVVWNLDEHPDLLAEMTRINGELIDLDTALAAPDPAFTGTMEPSAVYQRIAAMDSGYCWILANSGHHSAMAVITLPERIKSARLIHGEGVGYMSAAGTQTLSVELGDLGCAAIRLDWRR